ncbi:hypothetical protein ACOZ4N_14730 [Halorientalis pallida]|uniref:hypothetical protein n=1 Tax=Halorientalis pallida TaxID=2479928 RepID=UPI003C6FD49F
MEAEPGGSGGGSMPVQVTVSGVLSDAVGVVTSRPELLGVVLVGGIVGVVPVPIVGFLASFVANGVAVAMAWTELSPNRSLPDILDIRLLFLVAAAVVFVIGVGIGMVLLIVPGLYLASRLFLYPAPVMIDEMGPIDGLAESWDRTSGHTLTVFGILLILGLLSLVVGLVALFGLGGPDVFRNPQSLPIAVRLASSILGAPIGAVSAAAVAVLYERLGA